LIDKWIYINIMTAKDFTPDELNLIVELANAAIDVQKDYENLEKYTSIIKKIINDKWA